MKKIAVLVGFLWLTTSTVFAGGYGVGLQSQKFLGMGHAGTGLFLDGSAIFFNPGALSQQEQKWAFVLGVHPLFSTGYYQNQETLATSQTENKVGTPLEFYGSYKINDKLVAGIGFYTPFGNGIQWPKGWEGRALITSIQLKTYFVQPTLSYKVTDWLSIGGGLVIAMGDVTLKKDIPSIDSDLTLEGKADVGLGYNLGIYLQPNENMSIGINYRSKIMMNVKNKTATFSVPQSLSKTIIPNDTFSASLPMTSSLNIGMAYRFGEKWLVATDFNFNNWSEYEELLVEFDKNKALTAPQKRDYKNTITARIGVQYTVNEKLQARAGFYYDPSPVRTNFFSPETPSMNNLGFTLGGSYQVTERLGVDCSLLIINGLERYVGYKSDNFFGDFRSFAVSPGIGVSYKF
ncbi:MAG: outer membrane protein transport protein [Flavobacteriaceae bacterium]|nr:outer membrane protein transport protein [Flavobacteriaceae bacterium]